MSLASDIKDAIFTPLWQFISSGVKYLVGWIGDLSLWKMGIGGVLYWLLTQLNTFVKGLLPEVDPCELLSAIPDNFLYAFALTNLTTGLQIVGGAAITGFVIRRLPVIG